jgi:hypothetical protein
MRVTFMSDAKGAELMHNFSDIKLTSIFFFSRTFLEITILQKVPILISHIHSFFKY